MPSSCKCFVSLVARWISGGLLVLSLSACMTSPAPQNTLGLQFAASDDLSASVMRVGYRFKRAGEADQFILPPERFLITAIDDAQVTMSTTSNVALPISSGKHSITIAASGGLLAAEGVVNTTIAKNRNYQVTGWLNNNGPPVFVVWLEDSETGRAASPRTSIPAHHR